MVQELAYINGKMVKLNEAKVDALDRGFIFGDGLYEVIAFYQGIPYQMEQHLERYLEGASEILLENHPSAGELKEIADRLLQKSSVKDGIIYLQVTRGAAPRAHQFPENPVPGVFMFVQEYRFRNLAEKTRGVKTILVPDERWGRCNIKSTNLLPNCIYKDQARRRGAFEAIQVHPEVGVTEGTSSNVFGIKEGAIITAPTGLKILPGITRSTVLELAREKGFIIREKFLTTDELLECDEVFLTSSTNQLLPVSQIDQVNYPVSRYSNSFTLQEALQQHILEYTGITG